MTDMLPLTKNAPLVVFSDGIPEIATFSRFLHVVRNWNMRPLHVKIPDMSVSEMFRLRPRAYVDKSGLGDLTELHFSVSDVPNEAIPADAVWLSPKEQPSPDMTQRTYLVHVWMSSDGIGAIHGAFPIWTEQ